MWLFKDKTIVQLGLFEGLVDTHSHLLWGVDDGAKSAEITAEMIDSVKELGIKRMFCTPHIMTSLRGNNRESLTVHFNDKVLSAYKASGVDFRLAAEYMLDESFLKMITTEKPLTYDGTHILVETSYLAKPNNFNELIFETISGGYIPILAHPERYSGFLTDSDYLDLKDSGLKYQLNIISLAGVYGRQVKDTAEKLLLLGLYDFIGTDIHSPRMVKMIANIKISAKVRVRIEELVNNNNTLWI